MSSQGLVKCQDANGLTLNTRLIGLAGAVMVLHTSCTLLHEKVFLEGVSVSWFLTLFEFACNLTLEVARRAWARGAGGASSSTGSILSGFQPIHFAIAAALCLGRGSSNLSFLHLNYTTQQLMKRCAPPPTAMRTD